MLNLLNTVSKIYPVIFNKIYNCKYDKSRTSLYAMSKIYSPISFFSNFNHIIDNLYLGGCFSAMNWDLLCTYNITNIINVTEDVPNIYKELDYLNIQLKDDGEDKFTKEELDKCIVYINNNQNKNILVHCMFGRSRSTTIILYYIIKKYKYTINDAIELIKSKRYYINPSINFIENIEEVLNS